MKSRFFVLLIVLSIVLSMALCACNSSVEGTPTTTGNNATQPDSELDTLPDSPDVQVEPTDKGLFITEPEEIEFTLPSFVPENVLPEVSLDDEEGVFASSPLETAPEETSEATTAPSSDSGSGDVLPEQELD